MAVWNQCKTVFLLGSLTGLFLLIGYWIGGESGVLIAFVFSLVMNIYSYFYSDKIVLSMYQAVPLPESEYQWVYEIVRELSEQYKIPMPKLWYVPTKMANAFATGRNPEHASVAVTQGILELLDQRELRGVLAHELGHVKNRDILISTIAVTIASAIGMLANMLQWSAIFGGNSESDRGNPLCRIVIAILLPIAASMIQFAISRSREYLADESGAHICKDPMALASALQKLDKHVKDVQMKPDSATKSAVASLFIVYPYWSQTLFNLFSTHPPMEERVARLEQMAQQTKER